MGGTRGTIRSIAVAFALATSAARAAPVLVSASPLNDGSGYGGYGWTTFTADLNSAATVATTPQLTNLSGYDGVWVDLRQTALASAESTALSAYIATGRRVVFIGGNASGFGDWNTSILNLVGGVDGGQVPAATINQFAVVPLTIGVPSIYARGGDVAVNGTGSGNSLFTQRVATVWGPAQNAVVVLNSNVSSDNDVAKASNATFTNHLAQWVAGGLADPTSLWTSATGGAWQTGGNWLAQAMPAVADDAVFNLSTGYTTTIGGPVTARTVSVVSDQVTLDFNAAGAGLTIGSSLAVGTTSHAATLTVSHSTGGGTANLSAGSVAIAGNSALRVDPGVRLTTPALTVTGFLAVAGQLNVTAAAGTATRIGNVSIVSGTTGQFDLGSSDLIITGSDVGTISAFVAEAYDGGKWDGPGISSSTVEADASHRMGIGVIQNVGANGQPLYTTFDGQPVDATDVLVRPTLYGDTNLDGVIDAADYTRIDAGYIAGGKLTGWGNGDFNYDGTINGSDYTLMDNAYDTTPRAVASEVEQVVPEPTISWSIVLVICAGRRRRRSPWNRAR